MRAGLRAVCLTIAFCLFASGAQAAWYRAESKHFVVYGSGQPDSVRAYAERLEGFDGVLRRFHGLKDDAPVAHKLGVYVVGSFYEFQRFLPSQNIGGVYIAAPDDIFAVAIDSPDIEGEENVTFHEYTHHFMDQYFPYSYPAWLQEGWAEYFGTTVVNGTRIEVGKVSSDRAKVLANEWLPLETLLSSTAFTVKPTEMSAFYSEAWLLTHYMLANATRRTQLTAYMRAVEGGASPVDAMTQVTGEDLRTLTGHLKDYAQGGFLFTRIDRPRPQPADVTVTQMPPSADDLLMDYQRMNTDVAKPLQPALLARVRDKARKYPGDRLAELALARAEIQYGDRSTGEAILQRRVQTDAPDLETLVLLAHSYLEDAGKTKDSAAAEHFNTEARKLLVKANAIDANSYQVLYAYAMSHSMDADYPNENTLNALLLAQQLAPQVDDVRLAAAGGLIAHRRTDEAIALLTPLANSPHGGEGAEAAQKLLAQLGGPNAQMAKAPPAAP